MTHIYLFASSWSEGASYVLSTAYPTILMSLVFLWSLVIYILFGQQILLNACMSRICLTQWYCSWICSQSPMASLVTSNQSSLLTKDRSLCKRTVTCNIYCSDNSATTFGFWDHLTFYQDLVFNLSFTGVTSPRREFAAILFMSLLLSLLLLTLLCWWRKVLLPTRVRAAWEFWLLLLWVHFLFFILHTQPPFQRISFVLSCYQEESSPLKVSNNNKASFLAFVLCPGHSDETSHSKNLIVCSFICDLPLEMKDWTTCGIIQRFHLWFESSLYVTVCNFFHKKQSSGFHSYP